MSLRLLICFVIAGLAATPLARAAETVTPAQKSAFEQIIHDYILQHPEVIVEALQSAEEKMKAQSEERARAAVVERRQELLDDATAPVAGNPKGDVTLIEFFDYRCPYCKQVEPALEALLKEDRQLRIVYKELPILGKDSVYATRVALAARKQAKYDKFHAAMMATKGQIDEKVILQVATTSGLDIDRLKSDMTASEIDDIIKRNYDLAQALDIHGTPAFIVGGELIPGAIDIATMKQKIAAARKSG
ncbi:MAG TPA: DsbA family protein [Stellaceae bacterium]|jgi:protein-disulfide isomerase|nr:DsbA family protein [Stellaceae bacterium]